ncbi:MAG: helix-turn-helix domain-containing protein [Bacteroides sp.]|nr:helix-turn-helix domain-containing protein [Bacillota bacterium]MCM1393316.1 helix-turn-helix domain-containing protein [[Eubacterium] siraeum]MCM1455644.1 helix-turn-helix domain-containing protein [Bacteroides sp.]
MVTLDNIRKKLVEAIKQSGKSQKEIAAEIGVCPQAISQYVCQSAMPALDTFAKLCIVLDLDSNEILGIKK